MGKWRDTQLGVPPKIRGCYVARRNATQSKFADSQIRSRSKDSINGILQAMHVAKGGLRAATYCKRHDGLVRGDMHACWAVRHATPRGEGWTAMYCMYSTRYIPYISLQNG